MKFIPRKGAPDIPLEVLEAQESGNLVFFCGAGISYPAGLPNFGKLVSDVYDELSIPPNNLEKKSIKDYQYDRALSLLENRVRKGDVRKAITGILSLDSNADLSTHKAILELSSTINNKYRIVTTNVDHGFLNAEPNATSIIDAAPKLPVPKPHKWESIVHLHGMLDTVNDPLGHNLVFTSGDFGSAYLTERWASKFVTELFSNYTVLFVGYSVNDPVLRYMTDAIAADRKLGYKGFKKPYILARTKPKDREKNLGIWKAMDIEPILYSYRHSNLHNTLKAWAAYSRDGLNGKARIIKTKANLVPVMPYSQDDSVQQVIDTLKEKTISNHSGITGYPASVFSKLDRPPAPIEWLPVFDDAGLMTIGEIKDQVQVISPWPLSQNLIQPNKISLNLWKWLLNHLEEDILVHWVIDNGTCLHPEFKKLIKNSLLGPSLPAEPYLTFWKIVSSKHVKCGNGNHYEGYNYQGYNYQLIDSIRNGLDSFNELMLLESLSPFIEMSKSFTWPGMDSGQPIPPYKGEVHIKLSRYEYDAISDLEIFPERFTGLLPQISSLLNRALEFQKLLGKADNLRDRSYWDMSSISPHPQNKKFDNWVYLIELSRDLWDQAIIEDKELAERTVSLWKSFDYPVFRRLVFYAYTNKDFVCEEELIEYLLQNDGWWIWSSVVQREKFRLLAVKWHGLSLNSKSKVLDIILEGPPREMFREKLSKEEWQYRKSREIWHLLIKLESFGGGLTESAEESLLALKDTHPEWILESDEKDEFPHWFETFVGNRSDVSSEDLFGKPTEDIVTFLQEDVQEFNDGRYEVFRSGVTDNLPKTIEVLEFITERNIRVNDIWYSALLGMAEAKDHHWAKVSELLLNTEGDLFSDKAWSISWWVQKSISSVEPFSEDEQLFWRIAERLFEENTGEIIEREPVFEGDDGHEDIISVAINHPIGIMVEAFLDRFSNLNLKVNEGIPKREYLNFLNRIIDDDSELFLLGKSLIASRLNYLFALDPEWVRKKLIPLMNWQSFDDAKYVWQGYLSNPRISGDLASELHDFFLDVFANTDSLERYSTQVYQLFVVMSIEYPTLFNSREKQEAMSGFGNEGLTEISDFLWSSVRGEQENNKEYWKNRIKPFIKVAWPKTLTDLSSDVSENLALMCISLKESFVESVDTVKHFLVPFDFMSTFLTSLAKTDLPENYPEKTFELLSLVFSNHYQYPDDSFREILNRLVESHPDIQNMPKYREMNDFLIRSGI